MKTRQNHSYIQRPHSSTLAGRDEVSERVNTTLEDPFEDYREHHGNDDSEPKELEDERDYQDRHYP